MPTFQTGANEKAKKYSKLLNNLLNIKGRDQAIFTRVNNTTSFDIDTKFGTTQASRIIGGNNFVVTLKEQDLELLLKTIKKSEDVEDIIYAYKEAKERLFKKSIALLQDRKTFKKTKKELILKLEEKIQKSNTRWKQFQRKIIDSNIQNNIWPLHVATLFVTIKTDRRELYAPLLLREVSLDIQPSKIYIKSEDSWKFNEKAIFLLSDAGYDIEDITLTKDMPFDQILAAVGNRLGIELTFDDIIGEFENIKPEEIEHSTLTFEKGLLLGLFEPAGGHLRKTMLNIIENDEVDEIIKVDPDKSIYRDRLSNFIKEKSSDLVRIQPSNYSQDKALASALMQDTIIWGPPGTGKSQVIANIIANILKDGKTAIVMSQKKAALDVLKKRLGKIEPFVYFVLNDNNMVKSKFYEPLKKFVDMVENAIEVEENVKPNLISENEVKALEIISDAKKKGSYKALAEIISHFGDDAESINILKRLNKEYKYPLSSFAYDDFLKEMVASNSIKKEGFLIFKKYPKKMVSSAQDAWDIKTKYSNLDVNEIKHLSEFSNHEDIKRMFAVPDKLKRDAINNQLDGDYLVSLLGMRAMKKIKHWQENEKSRFETYRRFAESIRAGRALPYKFTNEFLGLIRDLFPIIVTTSETAFINWERNTVDYAVLDESSQMFLEVGLPILYLAKTKVLAGDNQQMQPSRWFATRDEITGEEEDVAENAESLLDYAFDKGVFQVMLDQNYRSSSASLMAFSAKKFYDSKLEVVDNHHARNSHAIEVIDIDGKWENGVNVIEARKTIEVVEENMNSYNKIIILAFNSNQRTLIEKIILEEKLELYEAMNAEKLMIRNIENIQGDEADLVVASVVYDPTTNVASTYVARSGGKHALNVAISRAKEKMIIVKSVSAQSIKAAYSDDFKVFRAWLAFLDLDPIEQKSYSNEDNDQENEQEHTTTIVKQEEVLSEFKKIVIEQLKEDVASKSNRVELVKQFPVGSKKIDIALLDTNGDFLLGIEVDEYNYHGDKNYGKYLESFSRQTFLESKGYKMFRIQELNWRIDKDVIISQIQTIIDSQR